MLQLSQEWAVTVFHTKLHSYVADSFSPCPRVWVSVSTTMFERNGVSVAIIIVNGQPLKEMVRLVESLRDCLPPT